MLIIVRFEAISRASLRISAASISVSDADHSQDFGCPSSLPVS